MSGGLASENYLQHRPLWPQSVLTPVTPRPTASDVGLRPPSVPYGGHSEAKGVYIASQSPPRVLVSWSLKLRRGGQQTKRACPRSRRASLRPRGERLPSQGSIVSIPGRRQSPGVRDAAAAAAGGGGSLPRCVSRPSAEQSAASKSKTRRAPGGTPPDGSGAHAPIVREGAA